MRRTRSRRVPVPEEVPAVPPGRAAAAPDVASRLTELQRSGGNQMVVRLLASARSVQSADGGDLADQRDTATALPLSDVARSRSEQIRAGASVRLLKVAAYNAAADRAIATYRDRQLEFAQRWGAAWDRHNTVLVRGGQQAATENF